MDDGGDPVIPLKPPYIDIAAACRSYRLGQSAYSIGTQW